MMNRVYLIGAGPGDRELITVKGARIIQLADVIVYDHLANSALLEYASEDCKLIYVGKETGHHVMKQEEINSLLVELGSNYQCVVRLKGGDPYVFGRGGEEGEFLRSADIEFEVVPGITSAIGGLAYAGIPITQRNIATSFHVITGHTSNQSKPIQYEHLAKLNGTLVFLMGVRNLSSIVANLLSNGKTSNTPVAIIYKASTPDQKVYIGELSNIVKIAKKEKVKPPSLIVVGEVVNYREVLSFYENKPLFGKHILVTRSRDKQSKMSDELLALGAKVTQLPTIKIKTINDDLLENEINEINKYTGIVFTSGMAVTIFFEKMKKLKLDARYLGSQKLIVIGTETNKVLEMYGLYADYIPEEFSKEGVAKLLKTIDIQNAYYMIPRSEKGDKQWIKALEEEFRMHEIHCYDTQFIDEFGVDKIDINDGLDKSSIDSLELGSIDYITFTSSSTVHGYMNQLVGSNGIKLRECIQRAKVVAIGPTTRKTLEEYNITVDLQPVEYTIKNMIQIIVNDNKNM